MPVVENYIAEVTVSVVLKSTSEGVVAEYSTTRKAKGTSYMTEAELKARVGHGAERVIEQALIDATAAQKALMSGVQNAENRRLK